MTDVPPPQPPQNPNQWPLPGQSFPPPDPKLTGRPPYGVYLAIAVVIVVFVGFALAVRSTSEVGRTGLSKFSDIGSSINNSTGDNSDDNTTTTAVANFDPLNTTVVKQFVPVSSETGTNSLAMTVINVEYQAGGLVVLTVQVQNNASSAVRFQTFDTYPSVNFPGHLENVSPATSRSSGDAQPGSVLIGRFGFVYPEVADAFTLSVFIQSEDHLNDVVLSSNIHP